MLFKFFHARSEGTSDNSPTFERRVPRDKMSSPEGTAEIFTNKRHQIHPIISKTSFRFSM